MILRLLLLFSFFTANSLVAQEKMTLLLDWFINPDHGPIIIAQEMGYFSDQNLEVEIIAPADPSAPPKLVAASQADLAVSYQPQLHLQITQGLPLIRVGTLVATPLNCLLVLEKGPIKTPKNLAGKKIGFSVAGVEEILLSAILEKYSVDLEDVELVNVNFSLSPSLMSGQVDAVIGAFRNFELNQMKIANVPGKCFFLEEEGVPPYDELIYVANANNIDKEKIRKFLKATELATQYIINNPEESWKIFASTSKELNDRLNRMAWADTLPRFALRPSAFDAGRYLEFQDFLLNNKLINKAFPISSIAIDVTIY
jgi:putative hydroxymethylpyrimidine transport system substrate-binding protein